jgi:SAM-dependent methyltransferase
MSNYINYLQKISSPNTFKRKKDYFKYNYGRLLFGATSSLKTLLEIGPGLGEFVSYLNQNNFNYIDILDNDKSVIDYIKSKFKIRNAYFEQRPSAIKNSRDRYDAIIITQVFEHIPKEQYVEYLKSLYELLNVGGKIIITVPNLANPFTNCELYADLTHYNGFTDVSLGELASYCGLENSKSCVYLFNIPPYSLVNIFRIVLQKILHAIIYGLSIINGGTYSRYLTPNITLVIERAK